MRTKLYFAAFAAAVALMGCENSFTDPADVQESGEPVSLTVSVSGAVTKISGDPEAINDRKVNSLQVFVFNRHGIYQASDYATSDEVTLTCTTGDKKVVALVNAPKEEGVGTFQELSQRVVSLENSGADNLVMVGSKDVTLAADTPITIEVKRLAAKICLNSVTLNFEEELHKDLSFEIQSVYLINVVGEKAYMTDNVSAKWFNFKGYDQSNSLVFLHDEVTGGALSTTTPKYSTPHSFYCYPNLSDTKTRLVIQAKIGSGTYYYPITLDSVASNKMYSYNVTLKRLGSDSPDVPLTDGSYTFNVSILDWDRTTTDTVI